MILKKRAYYIDSYSHANLHEMYDASSLLMFSEHFEKIEYRADKTSKNNVEILLGRIPNNIRYKSIHIIKENNRLTRLLKQIMSIAFNCYYILKADISELVIINYNTMTAIYPINWLTKLLDKKVLLVCHGEMYDLYKERRTNFLFRISKTFFINRQVKIAKGLFFAVLGDFILNNLKGIVSDQIMDKMISFDHSAIFHSLVRKNNKRDQKLRIGIIGSLRKSKGMDDILEVVQAISKTNRNIEFVIIGSFDCERTRVEKMGLTIPDCVDGSFLSRKKMYDLISSVDYALFLLPIDIYKFTSSGSFFDAIACETPIIALKNDFMEYYFKKYGQFGYLFNTNNDIILKLQTGILGSIHFNFKSIKDKLDPRNIAMEISQNIERIICIDNHN